MRSSIEYNYDFNYSINLESGSLTTPPTNQQKDLALCAHHLCEYQMIKSKEIQQFYLLLIKQNTFIKLGKEIQELVEMEFELSGKKNIRDMDQQYFLREELCETIKEVNIMLGRERDYYINLIVLFVTIILLRVIHKKHEIEMERTALFHFVHWELKGQHSTNIFYQTLLDEIVKVDLFDLYAKRRPIIEESANQSLTFKQVQSSINLKRSNSMVSSFALAFNKQNQVLNSHFKPILKTFKKGSNTSNSVIDLQSLRPTTFSNCNISK